SPAKRASSWKDECRKALENVVKEKKHSYFFMAPVDPVAMCIPEYANIITTPMDLGTVRTKLLAGEYDSPFGFNADVCTTFSNAITFNASHHP
ncbi:Bromodomain-containing protein, partial [Pavlovales sp. CCMP2436]